MEALSSVKMTMVTLWAECYCGTLSLWRPLFAKGLGYFTKVLSFCVRMPDIIHPIWQLFMAVHLIGCGSVPNLVLSVLYLTESLRSTWLASDCSGYWCEASYHLLATDTQQQYLTLEYKPWYHCGAYAKMIVVTTVMSDVCAMYWSNTGCCEWWGFCVTCWSFLQWIICSSSDFHPAMPTQFCNFPYISIIY